MKNIKICDTHNDFLTELELEEIPLYIENCKRKGAEIICASYWSSERDEDKIKYELEERSKLLCDEYLLHIEDLWWVKNEDDLKFLLNLKPFSCSLTWNNKNILAGGAKSDGRLTAWGKNCIEKLTENGTIIDVAHLNKKSFYQVANILNKNIYCSHTGFYNYKNNKRNLTDKQIELIVKSNGFIGLFFYDKCIKKGDKTFSINDIVKNIKYFTSHWGYDNLGIGSDFYGIESYPTELKSYEDFHNLFSSLLEASFSKKQIEKILYSNFKNFLSHKKKSKCSLI